MTTFTTTPISKAEADRFPKSRAAHALAGEMAGTRWLLGITVQKHGVDSPAAEQLRQHLAGQHFMYRAMQEQGTP